MSTLQNTPAERNVRQMRPWWVYGLLGLVLFTAGIVVLGDVVFASLLSALLIACSIFIAGVLQVVHAFWAKGWAGFLFSIVLGVIYIVVGVDLFANPLAAAFTVTLVLGVALGVSGIVRMVLATRFWREAGWSLLVSGIIGVLAGLVILFGWPVSGLWVLGFLLGIDLLVHGCAWIAYSWSFRQERLGRR